MTKPFEIPKRLVWNAFQRVKSNGGGAGVDQESIEAFEAQIGDNLYKLWNRMGSGCYFSPASEGRTDPKEERGHAVTGRANSRRSSRTDRGQDGP